MAALPEGAIPLVVGTVLALAGLTLVLSPLLGDTQSDATPERAPRDRRREPEREDGAIAALREIEFDRETGKLSDSDYAELRARYTKDALAELRASSPASAAPSAGDAMTDDADPVEAAIRRARTHQRACGSCGPRPEPDATYCSSCGSYLPGACGSCGAPVESPGSRFCTGCGATLAAA